MNQKQQHEAKKADDGHVCPRCSPGARRSATYKRALLRFEPEMTGATAATLLLESEVELRLQMSLSPHR